MKHMTLSEIADACCGIYCGDPAFLDCEVSSVAIDSRKVVKDTLFVAIKGARVDGHSFIPQVMEAGALCSLSEQDPVGNTHQGVPHIVFNFSDKLYTIQEKILKQSLANISLVCT